VRLLPSLGSRQPLFVASSYCSILQAGMEEHIVTQILHHLHKHVPAQYLTDFLVFLSWLVDILMLFLEGNAFQQQQFFFQLT
jgi:hypothetical protein